MSAYLRFPMSDALLLPMSVFGGAVERDRVEVLRIGPLDVGLLRVPPGPESTPPARPVKLQGRAPPARLGAFFPSARGEKRRNNYL